MSCRVWEKAGDGSTNQQQKRWSWQKKRRILCSWRTMEEKDVVSEEKENEIAKFEFTLMSTKDNLEE